MTTKPQRLCPVTSTQIALVQRLLGGKWKLVILWRLSEGIKRFGVLQKQLPNISQPILTHQLRELERDKLIHREVYNELPLRVEYSLTSIGENIIPVLVSVFSWINSYNTSIQALADELAAGKDSDPIIQSCHCGDYCICGDKCDCDSTEK